MKLKRLRINGFKNLNDFELDFTDKNGVTILIGNNGSGKSNVLEAISIIFMGLSRKENTSSFDYTIEYTIEDEIILVESNSGSVLTKVSGEEKQLSNEYLPTQIIACYSGETDRLWDIYKEYYFNVNRKKIGIENKPFLYINLDEIDVHKLAVIYNEIYETFIENDSEKIDELRGKYETLEVQTTLNSYHKKLVKNNKLMTFIEGITEDLKITINSLIQYYNSNLPNTKQDFLKYLLNCKSRRLIENFDLNEINTLSEGEKKLNLMELLLDILAEKNTLVLLDEPDSHIHVANKKKIKELLDKNSDIENEVILVTHSPTLAHEFDDQHIAMIHDGKIEDKTKQEVFSHITEGIWNYQEQSIFLSSTKNIILLVEGKHDKIHIKEAFSRLKDEYNNLDFDIFFADGANNLKQLVLGFSTTDFDLDGKKIIAVFDDDDDGRKGRNQQNFQKVDDLNSIYSLKSNDSFFGILLPKRVGFTGECTIENMYEALKYKNSMEYALSNRSRQNTFFNTGINDISKKIKEDAKNQLADDCKDFDDEDFKHFEKLFDLILDIKEL